MNFIFGLSVTTLVLLIEHWMPFTRKCHKIVNYAMGSGAILVGIAIWLGIEGEWITLLKITAFYLIGGLAVVVAYFYDHYANMYQRLRLMDDERNE